MDCNFALEESIFTNARRIADSDLRERYILDACGGNAQLQVRVRRLLRVLAEEYAFLEAPVEVTSAIDLMYGEAEEVGSSIGPYTLAEQIGVGGMGQVFLARQDSPIRRMVALKIIRPGMDSREVIRRFETERQALAQLNHPGITRLLDAGATEGGRPWYVMELALGLPITAYCRERALAVPERLRLLEVVCSAVHHAHQNGVIHRDIKPANVIVTEIDGLPVPKVIDFGVSRLRNEFAADAGINDPLHNSSRPESIVGTPAYMSPEQAIMADHEIDERCDVYALGMLLYQLLTDSHPFPEVAWHMIGLSETRRIIQEVSPKLPSQRVLGRTGTISDGSAASVEGSSTTLVTGQHMASQRLSSQLQGDLDRITMKAIEKDRGQRYQSVAEFTADIRRFLHHEPVHASSPSRIYRLKKLWRRRKSRVVVLALAMLLLIFAGASVFTAWISIRQRETVVDYTVRLDELTTQSQRRSSVNTLHQAFEAYFQGRADVAYQKLQLCNSMTDDGAEPGFALRYLDRLCHLQPRVLTGKGGRVFDVAFSPDSQYIVSCTGSSHLSLDIRNVATGEIVRSITGFFDDINGVRFSADGSSLITAEESRMIRVWDVKTGNELYRLTEFDKPLGTVYLANNQRTVITSEVEWKEKMAVTWVCDLQNPEQRTRFPGQCLLDVDESRGIVALVSDAGEVTLRRFPGLELISSLPGIQPKTLRGEFSPDGKLLATGSVDGETHVRQLAGVSDTKLPRFEPLPHVVRDVAFSPDNRFLIEAMGASVIHVWDTSTQTLLKVLTTQVGETWSCAVSPDGNWLAIGCNDGITELHSLEDIAPLRHTIREFKTLNPGTCVDPVSRDYALMNDSGNLAVYSSDNDRLVQSIVAPENVVFRNSAFSPDGKSLWVTDDRGGIWNFDRATEKPVQSIPTYDQRITPPIFSPNGELLAVSTSNSIAKEGLVASSVREASSGKEVFRLPDKLTNTMFVPHRINAFLDDSTVATTQHNTVARWNIATGKEILPRFVEPNGWIFYVGPVPGSHSLLLGLRDATVCIWDPASNTTIHQFHGLRTELQASTFSRDGNTLVTATAGGEVRLWDLPTGLLICELPGATGSITKIWFSKDETRLLAFAEEFRNNIQTGKSTFYVWDAKGL